jgi:hypothetical protein
MKKVRRSPVALAAIALALAATVVLAQTAVAAPAKKTTKSATAKAERSKGAGHTKLPPGKGAKDPGHGGTPPGQAKKELAPTQSSSAKSGNQGSPKADRGKAGSGTSSVGGSYPWSHTATVGGPDAGGSVTGQALSGGSSLGGTGRFNFRDRREFASERAAGEFRAPVHAFIEATRDMAFPIVLAFLVVLFLLLQGLMDRRDPKLAVAPLSQNEILSFE